MARASIPVSQNLVKYSNTLTNGSWAKTNTSVTSGATDPLGGTTAFNIVENGSTAFHQISQGFQITPLAGAKYTLSVYAKMGTRRYLNLSPYSGTFAYFDLQNGVVGSNSGFPTGSNPVLTISPHPNGGGWYLCALTIDRISSMATSNFNNYLTAAVSDGGTTYAGNNGDIALLFWRVQLQQANFVTPYVDTTSAVYNIGTPRYKASSRAAVSNRAAINNGSSGGADATNPRQAV